MKASDRSLIEKWVVSAAIGFVIRQLDKFGKETNWATVKADFETRAANLMPGTWFDPEVKALAVAIVDACDRALQQVKTLDIILNLLAEKNFAEASQRLRDYLLKSWKTEVAVDAKAKSLIEGFA